jgi:integrase
VQDHSNVRKGFDAALRRAGLPSHYSPHGLRHTFAGEARRVADVVGAPAGARTRNRELKRLSLYH